MEAGTGVGGYPGGCAEWAKRGRFGVSPSTSSVASLIADYDDIASGAIRIAKIPEKLLPETHSQLPITAQGPGLFSAPFMYRANGRSGDAIAQP